MKTKNKILVAVDLEEQALIALKYAVHFAELLDYELETVTVVEETNLISKLFSSDEIVVKLNQGIRERLDKTIEPFIKKVKINSHIAYGKPYEKISELANSIKPCFIIMGKSELSGRNISLLGSNSMHVILEAGFPVITINGKYDFDLYKKEHKEILVPLDLKKSINDQITAAIEFARLLNTGVRIYSVQTSGGKGREAKMLNQIAEAKKLITSAGIKCIAEINNNPSKPIYELIQEKAMEIKASMIIIMTRSESKLTEFIIGSKAMEIINNSNIPVMSIEPWDLEEGSEIFSTFFDPLKYIKK
ncbi:MAG: universal stress protein [Bacteroidales bacterium]